MTSKRTLSLLATYTFVYVFLFLFICLPYLTEKPRGIHQWAQADRVALAYRFYDGQGLNDPATLSMKTEDGKVGVEFSGYQYVIARTLRTFGVPKSSLHTVYRLFTFTLFYTALFMLVFKVLAAERLVFRALILLVLVSSPILLFYGFNFLPDILALSLILWSFYLFESDRHKYVSFILILLGLSLFIKTSSGIYFLSFYGMYFLQQWKKWDLRFALNTFLFFAIAAGVAYYDYYLVSVRTAELNSYVFLSTTRMASSVQEFLSIFGGAKRFLGEYLNTPQWLLLIALVIYRMANTKTLERSKVYFMWFGILAVGLLALILLFGIQYKDHDYYFISTFMPLILLVILRGLQHVVQYIPPRTAIIMAFVLASFSFSQGSNRYYNRMSEHVSINGVPEPYHFNWLVESEQKIDGLVPEDALVMVVYAPEPNHALVYLNRRGATFNTEEMSRDNNPFTWFLKYLNAQYVVCPTQHLEQLGKDEPEFLQQAKTLYSDKKLTLFYHGH